MREKKVPISLSKNDYLFLNYIQQGLIYSGRHASSTLDFSDIFKATVLYSMLSITDWENHGSKTVEMFLNELGLKEFKLPKTTREMLLIMKMDVTSGVLRKYMKQVDNEFIAEKKESYGVSLGGPEPLREPGVSNFILKLKDEEIDLFDTLKLQLETLKKYADPSSKDPISYSEMTRILFRITFIDIPEKDEYRQSLRFALLSSFYIKGVYGFSAVESTLLLYNLVGLKNLPKISKEGLGKLTRIFSDETLFKIYLEELKPSVFDIHTNFDPPQKIKMRRGIKKETFTLHNINDNDKLDMKYNSSVVPSVSFHSVFIGYVILTMEWRLERHKLPLLFSYFNTKNDIEESFVQQFMVLAYRSFQSDFEELFKISKEYMENPEKFTSN